MGSLKTNISYDLKNFDMGHNHNDQRQEEDETKDSDVVAENRKTNVVPLDTAADSGRLK